MLSLRSVDKAGPSRRGVSLRAVDRHRDLRPPRREIARGAHARSDRPALRPTRRTGRRGILAFAERILPRAADLWVQASLDQRQRFQQLFFPDGIAFDGNRFVGTGVTAPAFSYLRGIEDGNERMVDLNSASWNRVVLWMRQLDSLSRAS